jgi:mono/diheme cytochrome c family protein
MKLRHALIFTGLTILLAACNFSLAADVTPPPDYIPPTPMPTLGPLFPASAPDIDRGAAIYAEKCSPCHGVSGMGDGEQGKQLPVTVAAFALPETAHKASPASWFTTVSQGNLDRFMPPFTSLSEQERWDVVSYALTLHATPDMIAKGKNLFEAGCRECHKDGFTQEFMAGKSAENIAYIISKGQGTMKPVTMAEEDMYAVAAYLRTLTFALPPTPTPVPATEVVVTAGAGTPTSEGTPSPVTPPGTNVAGVGNVSGTVINNTGSALPAGLKVTLRGYDHGGDPNAGPKEVITLQSALNADGTYLFEKVEIPEKRIFLAELDLNGITYQSVFAQVKAGATELALLPITVYTTTEDYSGLKAEALQIYFDFANEQNVQILAVYSISNTTDKTVVVKLAPKQEIPFIKMPNNTASSGYQASPDSAPFVSLADGFAMPPSEKPYGLIAFATLPKENEIKVVQPVVMSIPQITLLLPEGVTVKGDTLSDGGMRDFQGGKFHMYTSTSVKAGGTVSFTLSGAPKSTTVNPDVTQNKSLLIGAGLLGLVLILAGAWMYWRDRNRVEEEDEEEVEFEDPESVMDAIIALDDLHRAGKLSDKAYQQRRDELKNALKRKS